MAGAELASAYINLYPKLKTNEIEAQLKKVDTTSAGRQMGDKSASGFASGFTSLHGIVKTIAASAAFAAAAEFVKSSVDAYANYEQLVGGVDTLFKESSEQLQAYAEDAYKSAGMSANQYMEMSTSFAASLLQSLGGDTAAAAEYANQAIIDMSDNANKMGTDIAMIQNAYQGFAKQNYTMLDNLKLGYGGTKEEMERLLEDAEALMAANGEMVDYSIESYADIVDAIHVVQTEMGITGTTALEASETISGSVASMQGQWSNWLTALANGNADITAETEKLVETVTVVISNIVPVVGQILASILYLIAQKMIDMATGGVEFIKSFGRGIADGFPFVLSEIGRGISDGIARIKSSVGSFTQAGRDLIAGMVSGITSAGGAVWDAITRICQNSLNRIKSFFGIASPSKVMREMFGYVGEGMALGLEDKSSRVIGAMTSVADGVMGAASLTATPALATAGAGYGGNTTNINLYCDIKDLQGIQTLNDLYDMLSRARAINPTRR